MQTAKEFLKGLRAEVEAHPGVNHIFLNRLATSPFSKQDYRVFAENHYALVCAFTSYLERLLVVGPDSETKMWLAKVLIDEYGEGSEGLDHSQLYAQFVAACGGDAPGLKQKQIVEPAYRFISAHRKVVSEEPFLVGLGAVGPGHEWAIPKMFHAVIPGLRRSGFSEKEIQYFTLHVEQDEDHGAWLEEALEGFATTTDAQVAIRKGALLSLEARAQFWSGVQKAVVRYRQPRAPRPDGPVPRSATRELLATIWDGTPGTPAIEASFTRWRNRHIPRLRDYV